MLSLVALDLWRSLIACNNKILDVMLPLVAMDLGLHPSPFFLVSSSPC
jgi:hypothetical protein